MGTHGAFICKNCRKAYNATGFWSGTSEKFKCKKHGDLCGDCVEKRLVGYDCLKCGGKVVRYEFKKSYGKWMKE